MFLKCSCFLYTLFFLFCTIKISYFLKGLVGICICYFFSLFYGHCPLLGWLFNLFYNVLHKCGSLSAAVELLFLLLLLLAAPFCSCSAAYCCCCCCSGLPSCSFCYRLHSALPAPLQGLPLAAPLMLQILGRTIVCSTVLTLTWARTCDLTIGTSHQQQSLLHCPKSIF